jgi:hypothetical protein
MSKHHSAKYHYSEFHPSKGHSVELSDYDLDQLLIFAPTKHSLLKSTFSLLKSLAIPAF